VIIDLDESDPNLVDPRVEPCASCGEETAEGGPLYYDRYTGRNADGTPCHLCLDCVTRLRAAGDKRLTEKDGALVYLAGMQLTMPTSH
jgi:hypothetical protein